MSLAELTNHTKPILPGKNEKIENCNLTPFAEEFKHMWNIAVNGVSSIPHLSWVLGARDKHMDWSHTMSAFFNGCLQVDPSLRSTAAELLRHPYMECAENRRNMMKILSSTFVGDIIPM